MKRYLETLKSEKIIRNYDWKRIKNRKLNMHKLLKNPPRGEEVFVLFGLCTTRENRKQLVKKLRTAPEGNAQLAIQIQRYHNQRPIKKESADHAVALSEYEGKTILSDTARKFKHPISDMVTLAHSLVCMHCLYVLRLFV